MNEKGAILPSIIVFVFLLVVILLGSVTHYRNQMHQLFATKESYHAKSMLMLTEEELITRLNHSERIEEGVSTFHNGKVTFKKTAPYLYQLKAMTNNQFTIIKQMKYVVSEESSQQSEKEESKGIKQ